MWAKRPRIDVCRYLWHIFLLLAFLFVVQKEYRAGGHDEWWESPPSAEWFLGSGSGMYSQSQSHYHRHLLGSVSGNAASQSKTRREIFLVGDSLLTVPESHFSISAKLKQELIKDYPSGTELIVKSFSSMSFKMHNISMGIQEILNGRLMNSMAMPDAIFFYGYSDMLDEFNSEATSEESISRQNHYRRSLVHLLKFLSHLDVKHVAVVGPSLFGGHGEMPSSWVGVHSVLLDNYVKINKEICEQFSRNAIHMDTRTTFRQYIQEQIVQAKAKPKDLSYLVGLDWKNNDAYNDGQMGGILTFDGEHTNLEGTALLIYMFVDQVRRWERAPPLLPLYQTRPKALTGRSGGSSNSIDSSRGTQIRSKQSAIPKSMALTLGTGSTTTSSIPKPTANPQTEPGNFFARLFSMSESKKEFASQEDAFAQELSAMGDQDGSLEAFGDQNHQPIPAELLKGEIPSAELSGSNVGYAANSNPNPNLPDGPSPEEGNYLEPGDEGTAPLDSPPAEDDRSTWSTEKKSCFEWRDTFGVIVGISWNRLPFELQMKWEQFNCNEYMDCYTAACSYHSGTLEHYNQTHPIYARPQSAGDWEIENGFIPKPDELAALKQKTSVKPKSGDSKLNSVESTHEDDKFLKPDVERLTKIHHRHHNIVNNYRSEAPADAESKAFGGHISPRKGTTPVASVRTKTTLSNKKVFVEPSIYESNSDAVKGQHFLSSSKSTGDANSEHGGSSYGSSGKFRGSSHANDSHDGGSKRNKNPNGDAGSVSGSGSKKKSGGGMLSDLFESIHPLLASNLKGIVN